MATQHMDPISEQDARLISRETARVHMVIGTMATFEGPAPHIDAIRRHVQSRLSDVPRYRQKLVWPPPGLGVARWVDDPTFNVDYHVVHGAVPAPGDVSKLHRSIAQIYSQTLDQTKPLWELYVIEGLRSDDGSRDRWALISKTHLALVDGADGIDLLTVLFDPVRNDVTHTRRNSDRWQPRPLPTNAQLTAAALEDRTRDVSALPKNLMRAAANPARVAWHAIETIRSSLGAVASTHNQPLDEQIGPHRRYVTLPADLADFRAVKQALDCTVNDVVLAVVAGGLRHWLHHRGDRTAGLEVNAAVPVSIRVGSEHTGFASRLTQVVAPLPVDVVDPVARVLIIRDAMREITKDTEALDADLIAGMADFAPPTILAQASRLGPPPSSYSLSITNIPGPQTARFVLGRQLQSIAPIGFLDDRRPLTVAVMSYAGDLRFGLLADYDAVPDIIEIRTGLRATIDELTEHVAAHPPNGRRRRS